MRVRGSVQELLRQHREKPLPSPQDVAPDVRVPDALVRVIEKATQKDPNDRYQSVGAMRAALKDLASTIQQRPLSRRLLAPVI